MRRVVLLVLICALAAPEVAHAQFDPAYEQRNYSKIDERPKRDTADTAFQTQLAQVGLANEAYVNGLRVDDPARDPYANLCAHKQNGCAGDIRLYDWNPKSGLARRVLFTNRAGATLAGHVWMTRSGPPKRPGIVITNGSVQAPEELYWFAATTLAKRGYVVLTFDPQGQGYSDTRGEGADANEGVPAQSGRPFFDGTEDALDFFLSTPGKPYVPRKSCTTGTSHDAKQQQRVREGLDDAYNPFHAAVDTSRIGIAGHSFGAGGVSFVGQSDPRVKAIVAWDNLSTPSATPAPCPSGSAPRAVPPITKPALGMSADYGLFRQPNTSEPDPLAKSQGSFAYSKAGVDTGEMIIRGGTHYEFSYIPNQFFGATLRGMDMVAWYTAAWFDKYVKGDASADARLLSGRWRADAQEAGVDPDADGNMFSAYYRSRLDIGVAGGGRVDCEDLRGGCPALRTDDGVSGPYSYLAEAHGADQGSAPAQRTATTAAGATLPASRSCRSRRAFTIRLRAPRGDRLRRVTVTVNGRRAKTVRRSRARIDLRGLPRTTARVKVVVRTAKGKRVVTQRRYRTCVAANRKTKGS
jgi:dienelactone hydrolase